MTQYLQAFKHKASHCKMTHHFSPCYQMKETQTKLVVLFRLQFQTQKHQTASISSCTTKVATELMQPLPAFHALDPIREVDCFQELL
jgi:hypothetical protein